MKNYFEHVAELNIAKERLEYKLKCKEELYSKYFNITSRIKDTTVDSSNENNDKMTNYLIELEETGLAKDIEELQNQVGEMEYYKKKMELYLSSLEGVQYDFIKLRYYEEHHYTLEEIALKLGYSIDRIKQLSAIYEKEIKTLHSNYTKNVIK